MVNINGVKTTEQTEMTDNEGKHHLFNLPRELKTNDGLLNVMIDYNGNTESISRSIPIVLNKISLVVLSRRRRSRNGLENNVALKP